MKFVTLAVGALLTITAVSDAATYTFKPNEDQDLYDLSHDYHYRWGINWSVPSGETITSATLTLYNIWDWRVEPDDLWIHLLAYASASGSNDVSIGYDNEGGGDYFANSYAGTHEFLTHWTDPIGGAPQNFNLVYSLSSGELSTLASYASNGNFGLGFDPDCHYFNDKVRFVITTTTGSTSVPDGGATLWLLGCAMAGLVGLRHRLR